MDSYISFMLAIAVIVTAIIMLLIILSRFTTGGSARPSASSSSRPSGGHLLKRIEKKDPASNPVEREDGFDILLRQRQAAPAPAMNKFMELQERLVERIKAELKIESTTQDLSATTQILTDWCRLMACNQFACHL